MKNLGLFSPTAIRLEDLTQLGLSLGGLRIGERTIRFGEVPDEAYLDLSVDLADGCFDADEFYLLEKQLGFAPVSYVSVHLNYSKAAFDRALEITVRMQQKWAGQVDYSGAGGKVDDPFAPIGG